MHPIHRELDDHLLKIYHKEVRMLPSWDLLAEVVQLAEIEPNFENIRYATILFYAIEDLLKIVKNSWFTYEKIDLCNHEVTIIRHDIYLNKLGVEHSEPFILKPDATKWDALYANQIIEQLNENPNVIQTTKFEYEIFERTSGGPLSTEEVIHFWSNSRNIQEYYRSAFARVINKNLSRNSFERFIERLQNNKAYSQKPTEQQLPIPTLNLFNMPDFATEIRETFEKKYVKVFLKDKSRFQEIQIVLKKLPSVKNVNITNNNEVDLTVYPNKVYSAEELEKEINDTLIVIFKSKPADPIIMEDLLAGVSEDVYQKILDRIYYFGQNLEHFKNVYSNFDEEGFRAYFLPYLNSMSVSHSATGETFNKIGKTDILIQNQHGETVFIAECKVWGGNGQIHPALDQLFERYVTWRDAKLALIIFNKTIKGFSEIIDKAIDSLKTYKLFKGYVGKTHESTAAFIFQHPEDKDKEVRLELMMFNCV